MQNLLHIIIAFVLLITPPAIATATEEDGFDQICQIYTEALSTNMSKEQLGTYIFDNIEQRVTSKDALDVHDAIFQIEPPRRYEVFKEAAEAALKRDWTCSAIKELMR